MAFEQLVAEAAMKKDKEEKKKNKEKERHKDKKEKDKGIKDKHSGSEDGSSKATSPGDAPRTEKSSS
jgi:hypothetical protein